MRMAPSSRISTTLPGMPRHIRFLLAAPRPLGRTGQARGGDRCLTVADPAVVRRDAFVGMDFEAVAGEAADECRREPLILEDSARKRHLAKARSFADVATQLAGHGGDCLLEARGEGFDRRVRRASLE